MVEQQIALAWRSAQNAEQREALHAEQRALERLMVALKAHANKLSDRGTR